MMCQLIEDFKISLTEDGKSPKTIEGYDSHNKALKEFLTVKGVNFKGTLQRLYEMEGCSICKIMRRTGYHYEAVNKYLNMEGFNEPHHQPKESISLLNPLKSVIDALKLTMSFPYSNMKLVTKMQNVTTMKRTSLFKIQTLFQDDMESMKSLPANFIMMSAIYRRIKVNKGSHGRGIWGQQSKGQNNITC